MTQDKVQPLREYWSRKVVAPIAVSSVLLVILLLTVLFLSMRAAENRNLVAILKTLAVVASDPILTGDSLELTKRISTVGNKNSMTIVVKDVRGNDLASYPPLLVNGQLDNGLSTEIVSTDGHTLGTITAKTNSPYYIFEPLGYGLVALFLFAGLCIFWLMKASAPILADIMALASSTQGASTIKPKFLFKETQETALLITKQSNDLVNAEKSRITGEVARQVAHDIRSPLGALLVATEAFHDEKMGATKQLILGATNRIKEIAEELLLSSGEKNHGSEMFKVMASIEQIVEEKKILGNNLSFDLTLKNDLAILANKSYFQRAISNFITNAMEAAIPGRALKIKIVVDAPSVTLSDNGAGIDTETLRKLQAGESSSTKPSGYGLGFIGSVRLLNEMGFRVEVNSQLNEGTELKLTYLK